MADFPKRNPCACGGRWKIPSFWQCWDIIWTLRMSRHFHRQQQMSFVVTTGMFWRLDFLCVGFLTSAYQMVDAQRSPTAERPHGCLLHLRNKINAHAVTYSQIRTTQIFRCVSYWWVFNWLCAISSYITLSIVKQKAIPCKWHDQHISTNLKSLSTGYEDMKDGSNCRKWGDFGQLGGHSRLLKICHLMERIWVPIRFP